MSIFCKEGLDVMSRAKTLTGSLEHPVISCRNCRKYITQPSCQMQMDGSFVHTFANPLGHVFEIGCFDDAPGCLSASPSSSEFSWFKGYSWEIGVCHGCDTHLGWVFHSDGNRFFGLILDKLIFPL
jgi:hypothetical protein